MMFKTHLMAGVFLAVLFLPIVTHQFIFVPILLLCSLLPDIDSMHSLLGRYKVFRPLQWFIKHRDLLHSYTICFLITILLMFYLPMASLAFFLGYVSHLILDSMTIEGIRPFWPLKTKYEGKITTNGRVEKILFYFLVFASIALIVRFFI